MNYRQRRGEMRASRHTFSAMAFLALACCAAASSNSPSGLLRGSFDLEGGVRFQTVGPGLAKGIAFDGTNFLVALQSSNQVMAQFLDLKGSPVGETINLGRTD